MKHTDDTTNMCAAYRINEKLYLISSSCKKVR